MATGMLTELVYLQDGMPAKFQNRKLDDGMGLERTNKRTNEQARLRAVNSTKILRGQIRHQQPTVLHWFIEPDVELTP